MPESLVRLGGFLRLQVSWLLFKKKEQIVTKNYLLSKIDKYNFIISLDQSWTPRHFKPVSFVQDITPSCGRLLRVGARPKPYLCQIAIRPLFCPFR